VAGVTHKLEALIHKIGVGWGRDIMALAQQVAVLWRGFGVVSDGLREQEKGSL